MKQTQEQKLKEQLAKAKSDAEAWQQEYIKAENKYQQYKTAFKRTAEAIAASKAPILSTQTEVLVDIVLTPQEKLTKLAHCHFAMAKEIGRWEGMMHEAEATAEK